MTRGIHTCCPEVPTTINITQNIIEMDGTKSFFATNMFTGAQAISVGYLLLDYVPYAQSSVQVILNTGSMYRNIDFTLQGNRVYLGFTPQSDDKIEVRYFALTDNTTTITNDSALTVGMMVGFGGGTVPDGWLAMDGTTQHLKTEFADLYAWLSTVGTDFLKSSDATTFTLKSLPSNYFDGSTLVTGTTIIKT